MGKMDEKILAVNRAYLFEDELLAFQGMLTDYKKVGRIMKRFSNYVEVRRGDAEEDASLKQPIPYAVLRRGDEVFIYKRLRGSGEARLHDQLSIGIGGHMNRLNDVRNWNTNLTVNLYRELSEEVEVTGGFILDPRNVGLINDDNDDAGLYHIGIVMILDLPDHADVKVRETDKLEGCWVRAKDLTKSPLFESLESWSQIIVEAVL